jgi:hypothetical protein
LTTDILLAVEKLIYYDNLCKDSKGKLAFLLDIPVLDKFVDPHALSCFPIFNF